MIKRWVGFGIYTKCKGEERPGFHCCLHPIGGKSNPRCSTGINEEGQCKSVYQYPESRKC